MKCVLTAEKWSNYTAFGSPMNGRQFNSSSYKYGFNGKEKIDEINGSGNSVDFGARIYDSRLGRMLSIDPLWKKFSEKTPYSFAGDNPILKIDVEGGFEIPIHKMITEVSAKISKLNADDSKWLARGAQAADYLGFSEDWHFDGRGSFKEINDTWKGINKRIAGRGGDYFGLGADLHNVQDFYSHSNYVELFVEYYKSTNNGALPNDIPSYTQGLKNSKFKAILEGKLHTGKFGVTEFLVKEKLAKKTMPADYHQQMNKDDLGKGKDYEHNLAKIAAAKHSVEILNEHEKKEASKGSLEKTKQEVAPAVSTQVNH